MNKIVLCEQKVLNSLTNEFMQLFSLVFVSFVNILMVIEQLQLLLRLVYFCLLFASQMIQEYKLCLIETKAEKNTANETKHIKLANFSCNNKFGIVYDTTE